MAHSPFKFLGRGVARTDSVPHSGHVAEAIARMRAADDNEDDRTPKENRDDDEAEKARKAKRRAKDKKDDEDDDEESKKDRDDENDAKASAARARERDRVRAILTSGPGLANPVVGAHMALDTSMPRRAAVAAIGSLNAAKGIPDFDPDGGDVSASMASAILAAGAKARGEATPKMPGQRRRMELPEAERAAPPRRDMAAAIIEAGRKARGEI